MDITHNLWFDLPVIYKGLKLYPVRVKDFMELTLYSQCLRLDKNSIPDPKIIQMSELAYLFLATTGDETEIDKQTEKKGLPALVLFDRLLALALRDDPSFDTISESIKRYTIENEKPYFLINDTVNLDKDGNVVNQIKYTEDDFLRIREILARQNDIALIDNRISKEVRDAFEQARLFKAKGKGKAGSLEDYIISLASATGWTFEYIYEMSIRKFQKTLSRYDNFVHYKIYLAASMSGMVSFKDTSFIKHWLSNITSEDEYGDVSVGLEDVKNTVSLESAKSK